jgi:hypothetical protein
LLIHFCSGGYCYAFTTALYKAADVLTPVLLAYGVYLVSLELFSVLFTLFFALVHVIGHFSPCYLVLLLRSGRRNLGSDGGFLLEAMELSV